MHTTYVRGTEPQPAAVSVVAPAAMPAGASGDSSAIAASATAVSTSPKKQSRSSWRYDGSGEAVSRRSAPTAAGSAAMATATRSPAFSGAKM